MRQTQARGETLPSLRDLGTTVSQTLTPKRQGVPVGINRQILIIVKIMFYKYPSIKYNHVQYVHFNIIS